MTTDIFTPIKLGSIELIRKGCSAEIADQSTFYGGSEKGYTDYPTL